MKAIDLRSPLPAERLRAMQEPARKKVKIADLRFEADDRFRVLLSPSHEEVDVAGLSAGDVGFCVFRLGIADFRDLEIEHPRNVARMKMDRAGCSRELAHDPEALKLHSLDLCAGDLVEIAADQASRLLRERLFAALEDLALRQDELHAAIASHDSLCIMIDMIDQTWRHRQPGDHWTERRIKVHRRAFPVGCADGRIGLVPPEQVRSLGRLHLIVALPRESAWRFTTSMQFVRPSQIDCITWIFWNELSRVSGNIRIDDFFFLQSLDSPHLTRTRNRRPHRCATGTRGLEFATARRASPILVRDRLQSEHPS